MGGGRDGVDIVVVDDDPVGLELLQMVLEAEGHTVRASSTAAAALDLLTEVVPSILVTDLMMGPDRRDGVRLIERVRRRPELSGLPVVALSGVTGSADLALARSAGADVCLAKPIDVMQFLQVVSELSGSGRGFPSASGN